MENQEVWVLMDTKTKELWSYRRGRYGGATQNAWPDQRAAKTHFSRNNEVKYDNQTKYKLVNLMEQHIEKSN